jgi:hypothetical protein
MIPKAILATMLAAMLVGPAMADGTLEGLLVTFSVETWDDPAAPMLQALGRTVTVGTGVEFGLEPEGLINGLDVVPVTVEILPTRIELRYPRRIGRFYEARFNGYVLRFETDCALFEAVTIDPTATTMPIKPEDLRAEAGALYINVSGLGYGPQTTLAIDVTVADCPIS